MPRQKKPAVTPEETSAPKNDPGQQAKLLEIIFGEVPDTRILFSTQRRSETGDPEDWNESALILPADDLAGAVTRMADLTAENPHSDIYFCVTPRNESDSNIRRAENTHSLTCLWADFDMAASSAGKDAARAWQSYDDIAGWTFEHGIPEPTAVVHSGNGWHLYWALDAPLMWGTDGQAEQLLARWGAYLMEQAVKSGKHLDHVFDPSRVLRVPGTTNWKPGWETPIPVELLDFGSGWKRYGYNELDELLPPLDSSTASLGTDLGEWRYLTAQDVLDTLTALSSDEGSPQGEALAVEAEQAMRVADQGGRHASAYAVLAGVIQRHKFPVNVQQIVDNLQKVWQEVKPDAERNEWRNLVTHVTSRRSAEFKKIDSSTVDTEQLRKLTPEEETGVPDVWQVPQPLSAREVNRQEEPIPDFPVDALPKVMADFVKEVSSRSQTDPTLPSLAAIGSAAAATAGGWEVHAGQWDELLMFYLVGVADPSERKTSVLAPFQKSIYRATGDHAKSVSSDRNSREAETSSLERAVKEAEKSGDKVAHAAAMDALDIHMTDPDAHRLITPSVVHGDITQEALLMAMAEQNGVGWVVSAEGTFISNLAGRYDKTGNGVADLGMLNDAWSGAPLVSGRITRGISEVRNPHLNLTMFVQPSVAAKLSAPGFAETGFMSRFLYADPKSAVGHRTTKLGTMLDSQLARRRFEQAESEWQEIIGRMFQSGWGRSPEDRRVLEVDSQAFPLFENAWAEAEQRAPGNPWWGKYHGMVLRMAGLFAVIDDPVTRMIDLTSMERGVQVMEFFATEHQRWMRGEIMQESNPEQEKMSSRILGHIAKRFDETRHGFTVREVLRWVNLASYEVEPALEMLIERGWLMVGEEGMNARGAKLTPHPDTESIVKDGFANLSMGTGESLTNPLTNEKCQSEIFDTSRELENEAESSSTKQNEQDTTAPLSSVKEKSFDTRLVSKGVSKGVSSTGARENEKCQKCQRPSKECQCVESNVFSSSSSSSISNNDMEAPTDILSHTPPPKTFDTFDTSPKSEEIKALEEALAKELSSPEMKKSLKTFGAETCPICDGFIEDGICLLCQTKTTDSEEEE